MTFQNEDYSMTLLADALFEVLHNTDHSADTILAKLRAVLEESETYLEKRLDRTRDVLRYFKDYEPESEETPGGLDFTDGYEWTPLPKDTSLSDYLNKSPHYWDLDRNR